MPKKTWNEKLNSSGDLPKVEKLANPKQIERCGTDTMVIAPPVEYDQLMKKVPAGRLTTIDRMMHVTAEKHGAGCACPMTAGIFVKIAAYANEERSCSPGGQNKKSETPWWRTLKKNGMLNEKFPDGIEGQRGRLTAEGHKFIEKGKNCYVENYEKKICRFR